MTVGWLMSMGGTDGQLRAGMYQASGAVQVIDEAGCGRDRIFGGLHEEIQGEPNPCKA
jgi:hypothetical protein